MPARWCSSAAAAGPALQGIRAKPQLSPLAQLVAAQHIVPAFSPIVVAGMVRFVEFVLIAVVGVAIYFGYVYTTYGQIRLVLRRDRVRRCGASR